MNNEQEKRAERRKDSRGRREQCSRGEVKWRRQR